MLLSAYTVISENRGHWSVGPHPEVVHSSNWIHLGVFEVAEQLLLKTFPKKSTPSSLLESFWPLTASITLRVKNNYAHDAMTQILNKISEIKFSVGCMVWL